MAFVEFNERLFTNESRPVLLNTRLITDVFEQRLKTETLTAICLCSMDGDNNPVVYHVIESYTKVKNMILAAEAEERRARL